VRELTTRDWQLYIESLARKRSDLSASTRNMLMATFRNVLKGARDDGLIDMMPDTPRIRQKDNPRSFFRFAPLVPSYRDDFEALLAGAKQLARDRVIVRGVEATEELYDLIVFAVSSFVPRHPRYPAGATKSSAQRSTGNPSEEDSSHGAQVGHFVSARIGTACRCGSRIESVVCRHRIPDTMKIIPSIGKVHVS
jgi:hypothetical protein